MDNMQMNSTSFFSISAIKGKRVLAGRVLNLFYHSKSTKTLIFCTITQISNQNLSSVLPPSQSTLVIQHHRFWADVCHQQQPAIPDKNNRINYPSNGEVNPLPPLIKAKFLERNIDVLSYLMKKVSSVPFRAHSLSYLDLVVSAEVVKNNEALCVWVLLRGAGGGGTAACDLSQISAWSIVDWRVLLFFIPSIAKNNHLYRTSSTRETFKFISSCYLLLALFSFVFNFIYSKDSLKVT